MTTQEKEGNAQAFNPQKYTLNLGDQMKELTEVTEKYKAISENPFLFAQIFIGLKTAFDNFNALLLDLNRKLDEISERMGGIESSASHDNLDLSKKDQEILDYVTTQGKVTAEDLQKHFDYKGKNAASARLHRLFAVGMLDKTHAGRTVYYTASKPNP